MRSASLARGFDGRRLDGEGDTATLENSEMTNRSVQPNNGAVTETSLLREIRYSPLMYSARNYCFFDQCGSASDRLTKKCLRHILR